MLYTNTTLVVRVAVWIQSCHHDSSTAVVVISTIIMSGLILLRVAAAPPCKKPLSTPMQKTPLHRR